MSPPKPELGSEDASPPKPTRTAEGSPRSRPCERMRKTRFVGRSKTTGALVVEPRRRQREAGDKIGVVVGTAFAIFQGIVVRGAEVYPPLYSRVVFCDLVEAFERLVTRNKSETGTPQVTAKVFDAPDDAARFQIERDPVTFILDGGATNEHNGANGVVILLLFEGGTETVHTGITVEEKSAGVVADGVPVRVDEDRGRGKLGEQFPHNGFRGRSKDELDALFEKGGDGPYPLRHIALKIPVIGKTTQ